MISGWLVSLLVKLLGLFKTRFATSASSSSNWSTDSTVIGQGNVVSKEHSLRLSRAFPAAGFPANSTMLFPEGPPQSSTMTTALSTWPNTKKFFFQQFLGHILRKAVDCKGCTMTDKVHAHLLSMEWHIVQLHFGNFHWGSCFQANKGKAFILKNENFACFSNKKFPHFLLRDIR